MRARERFAEIARKPDAGIDLLEAALQIAAEEYPSLSVRDYLERVDALARAVEPRVEVLAREVERVGLLNGFLFEEQGFSGNREDYYDPRNSFLNDVIDRRRGIPITLSIVYIEVARRVGLSARGIGFPGHFLVKALAEPEIVVDPFFHRVLTREQCGVLLREATGAPLPLRPEVHLRAATNREILVRLLSNLKQIWLRSDDLERALACSERILLLVPDDTGELRDRGLLYERLECYGAALADLERFLELEPEDASAASVRDRVVALRAHPRRLH